MPTYFAHLIGAVAEIARREGDEVRLLAALMLCTRLIRS